ncbi:MAG: zf-HC2 domain-containing protein [Elusimicrobiota bacterium]
MKCKKYKIMISAYADKELNPVENNELLKHITTCEECKNELIEIQKIKAVFSEKKKAVVDDYFETRLRAKIESNITEKKAHFGIFGRKMIAGAFAFMLLLTGSFIQLSKVDNKNNFTDYEDESDTSFDQEIYDIYYY